MGGVNLGGIIEICADNPPTALIAGGFLLIILGVLLDKINPSSSGSLQIFGVLSICAGIVLHLLWLNR
jgi:F0F1-type ATP synthase assembly protein I